MLGAIVNLTFLKGGADVFKTQQVVCSAAFSGGMHGIPGDHPGADAQA